MTIISTDGAGRKKDEFFSTSAIVILDTAKGLKIETLAETNSTTQRGELNAFIEALKYAIKVIAKEDVYIITDSEYVSRAYNNKWFEGWSRKGWVTVKKTKVVNQDLWEEIMHLCDILDDFHNDVMVYSVKGHVLSVGKVEPNKLITSGNYNTLLAKCKEQYDDPTNATLERITHAREMFKDRFKYAPPSSVFRLFIIMNTMADCAAEWKKDQGIEDQVNVIVHERMEA